MAMPNTHSIWTRDEVLALPEDGKRYELLHGELLVSPSPRWIHQVALGELFVLIRAFVKAQRVGAALFSPADLAFDGTQLLQPDLFVVATTADGREPRDLEDCTIPTLVVEVLSPGTARYDRITKRNFYLRSGVAEYWIVDVDARLIERWTPLASRPDVLDERIEWRPEGSTAPLVIDLPSYFTEVWGER